VEKEEEYPTSSRDGRSRSSSSSSELETIAGAPHGGSVALFTTTLSTLSGCGTTRSLTRDPSGRFTALQRTATSDFKRRLRTTRFTRTQPDARRCPAPTAMVIFVAAPTDFGFASESESAATLSIAVGFFVAGAVAAAAPDADAADADDAAEAFIDSSTRIEAAATATASAAAARITSDRIV
jgi:hypothetical protein